MRAYIEAAPGSGKTTVAAERFGVLRYTGELDTRAVVAVSFTRSATWELRQRIRAHWGPTALCWPHQVTTIDTVLYELLAYLLRSELIRWPGGHTALRVIDTWKVRATHQWTRRQPLLRLQDGVVTVAIAWRREQASRIDLGEFSEHVHAGVCTHDDVRTILTAALADSSLAKIITKRLVTTTRAFIVDEIFDANPLDLRLVELACRQGIATTIIGDPWQALYRFRGAGPELVPHLIRQYRFDRYPLTRSFRFRTEEAQQMSSDLRAKRPVTLPDRAGRPVDVVLAGRWEALWGIGGDVLPLSFGSPDGPPAAAALLLLDHITSTTMGHPAVFLDDALTNLGITDLRATERLGDQFRNVLTTLRSSRTSAVNDAWDQLVAAINTESQREFPRRHYTHTARLNRIRQHLLSGPTRLIPGLTVHQAKGREWDVIGVRLTPDEQEQLRKGLDERIEAQRQIYVALTRAKNLTLAV
jgi:DNA helicase II / ATP-dependent DNA helicase PcrA